MNLETLIPLLSQVMGRDLSPELALFNRTKAAVGSCLNRQGQEFLTLNYKTIPDFMETVEGREATTAFLNAWVKSLLPATITQPPAPEPAPLPALEAFNQLGLSPTGEVSQINKV